MRLGRTQLITVIGLLLVLVLVAFLTYSLVSPKGWLSGLPNDLKLLEGETGGRYTDLDGNPFSIEAFKGKPLVVNAWATWMPFSKDELSLLNRMKAEYGEGVEVVAINRMETAPTVNSYMSIFEIGRGITFLLDPEDHFYKAIGGYAMPETVFYHDDGTISFHKRGVLTEGELRENIERIIGK